MDKGWRVAKEELQWQTESLCSNPEGERNPGCLKNWEKVNSAAIQNMS
jgi:hypothetical protein